MSLLSGYDLFCIMVYGIIRGLNRQWRSKCDVKLEFGMDINIDATLTLSFLALEHSIRLVERFHIFSDIEFRAQLDWLHDYMTYM